MQFNFALSISAREWTRVLLVTVFAVALVHIPYGLGYAFAPADLQFTGIMMNPEDSQSYFAKMLQGYDGNWLYTIPFTTEEHAPAFVGGFYIALGHFARVSNLSLEATWHLARIVADGALFLVTFMFIATFLPNPRARWIAYWLALFGSGQGWLLFLFNQPYWLDAFPVDFKMPEAHLFFCAMAFPHVALGATLIQISFWCIVQAVAQPVRAFAFAGAAGITNLALAIVYPFLIYLTALTTGLYWIFLSVRARRWLWREQVLCAIAFLIPAPLVLGYAWTLATNPVFRAWDAQSITLSPPLPHYVLAYGVLLLFAAPGLRLKRGEFTFLWVWLVAVGLLVYAPLNPQRRFVQGVHIPLVILATVGFLDLFLPWVQRTRAFQWLIAQPRYSSAGLERFLIVAFLIMFSLSNWYILASVSLTATVEQPYPLFRPLGEAEAVAWLRTQTTRSQVVVGLYESGNYIAARAGNRVVVGHWAETLEWETKFDAAENFFGVADDAWRRDFLTRYRVEYVWFGARERASGGFEPRRLVNLEPVYSNSDVMLFKVLR
ncbi:MAG: hypothetical protein HZC40_14940 [Chloroflexi bacterium]|nr:hypothetical protein [Chloroflexota bacterium]